MLVLAYALGSCDVSDALCKLKHPGGGFLPGLTMWSPQRQMGTTKIVGPAYTVKYVLVDDPEAKHPTHYVSLSYNATQTVTHSLTHYP